MTPEMRRVAVRKLLEARGLYEAAHDLRETADELAERATLLVCEAKALEAGVLPLPRLAAVGGARVLN